MSNPPAHRRQLANRDDALLLVNGLIASLGDLGAVLDEETDHLRVGKLKQAMALHQRKSDASRRYMHMLQAASANAATLRDLAPERLEAFRKGQETFNMQLQHNLTVLATAQALSDSLVQEIATAVARVDTPTAYSARGTTIAVKTPDKGRPISLSRSL